MSNCILRFHVYVIIYPCPKTILYERRWNKCYIKGTSQRLYLASILNLMLYQINDRGSIGQNQVQLWLSMPYCMALKWGIMSVLTTQITGNSTVLSAGWLGLTTKETSKLRITGLLWGESTDHRWFPLTKGQWWGKRFHVVASCCNLHIIWDILYLHHQSIIYSSVPHEPHIRLHYIMHKAGGCCNTEYSFETHSIQILRNVRP